MKQQHYTMEPTKEHKNMKVLGNDGEVEQFQPKRIKDKIIEETQLSETGPDEFVQRDHA